MSKAPEEQVRQAFRNTIVLILNLPSFPSGQGHHRSRLYGEAGERYLPRCLHFHDKGEYQCLGMAAEGSFHYQ